VFADVGQPDRFGVGDEQAQHAAAARQVADLRVDRGVHAVGDEVGQVGAVGADHPERAVAGAGQRTGGLDDALQGGAQVEVGADTHDRVQQCA